MHIIGPRVARMRVTRSRPRLSREAHSAAKRSNVSLQQLLNSMDGLGTKDGIIVVATANDPTVLASR